MFDLFVSGLLSYNYNIFVFQDVKQISVIGFQMLDFELIFVMTAIEVGDLLDLFVVIILNCSILPLILSNYFIFSKTEVPALTRASMALLGLSEKE